MNANAVPVFDSEQKIGVVRLSVDDGYSLVGIENKLAVFECAGKTRSYQLPVGDRSPCTIEMLTTETNFSDLVALPVIREHEKGKYLTDVTIKEGNNGEYWAFIQACDPQKLTSCGDF